MNNLNWSFWIWIVIILILLSIILWWLLWKLIYDRILEKKWKDIQTQTEQANEKTEKIIEKANEKAEKIVEANTQKAEIEAEKIIERAEKQSLWIIKQLEEKQSNLLKKEEELMDKKQTLNDKEKKVENKIFEIWKLSEQDAKNIIFDKTEKEYSQDLFNIVEKIKKETTDNAKKEANAIIAKTIYRVAVEKSNNFLVETVELPSEDYKWRIIWREWRNIQFFEQLTWVNLSMDDTPWIVKISSFEPEKRFIAKITLEKLIKDGRINPVYIEKYFKETEILLPEILQDIWKETLLELWIPMMDTKILEYIGRFELRYSYGQNLLSHSKEVAKISELLAAELWYDTLLAKKAWLLHDIGKIDVNSWESHPKVWANILRQHNFSDIVVNAAESHHFEVPQIHPISWIVTAADAISAGREWVRNNSTDRYIERIKELENLVLNVEWVKKAYIMQAGREIWAFVDENIVSDFEVQKLNQIIKNKIKENLDYPGIIKVMSIRENKVIDYVG